MKWNEDIIQMNKLYSQLRKTETINLNWYSGIVRSYTLGENKDNSRKNRWLL